MSRVRKLTVITPCLNAEQYIEETVRSVLDNSLVREGLVELEYFICDGGSEDGTVPLAEELLQEARRDGLFLSLRSEKDRGMYDALVKGLERSSGDVLSYINAGDFYSPDAFRIVRDIFDTSPVQWLTGLDVVYDDHSRIVLSRTPFRYKRALIEAGLYNLRVLPHIQQESTFWRRELNGLVDHEVLRRCRYAGDFYLWKSFSRQEELYVVDAWLGGFKVHSGQLSRNRERYDDEMRSLATSPSLADHLSALVEKALWKLPPAAREKLNRRTSFRFNPKEGRSTPPPGL
jgi:glycosyltransferase involved in cell wall biosynthesis